MTTAKTQTPKVSVCIPTYRGAATIGQAIESVLAQSLTDFELIIIDDGSPDDTSAIVERFTDSRLVYLRNEHNLGPQGNWNRCLEVAQGEYFKLLPHDDLLYPRCLERQVAVLNDDCDENIALAFSARDVRAVQITDSACFSAARHYSSLLPPRSRSYLGDNYSEVGGNSRIYRRACRIAVSLCSAE